MRVSVVNYEAGNLTSVCAALRAAGAEVDVIDRPEDVRRAERLVLPGVGAACSAMLALRNRALDEALTETVRRRGRPMLGICLGMQLLAKDLYEFGHESGLGWIDGAVVNLGELVGREARVPHTGWNRQQPAPHAVGLPAEFLAPKYFYFNHSYALKLADPACLAATVQYDVEIVAAIRSETVFATQYHPEISQRHGRRLIKAFLEWKP